jgi:hypothetical protein
MATTATVETATTTAAVIASAIHVAAGESASNCIPVIAAAIRHWASNITRVSIPVTRVSIVSAIAIDSSVTVAIPIAITTPVPGAGTDEHTAGKPRWTIVAIRSAGIRIVAVIPISADRSRVAVAPIHRATDANTNRYLRMGISRSGHQQDTEQCEIA